MTGPLSSTLAHADIAAIVDLTMVPYGNTKQNADGTYTCQHGADECTSDVIEMCVMYKLGSGNISNIETGATAMQAFPFLQCMEQQEGNPASAEGCFSKTMANSGLSWSTVQACANTEAKVVQDAGAKATPKHDYVPWPLVNGVVLENTNLLQKTICDAYTGPKPTSCKLLASEKSICLNK